MELCVTSVHRIGQRVWNGRDDNSHKKCRSGGMWDLCLGFVVFCVIPFKRLCACVCVCVCVCVCLCLHLEVCMCVFAQSSTLV